MNISSKTLLFIAAVLGIFTSIFVGVSFYNKETKTIEQGFRNDVADKVRVLESELLINLEVLYALKGLFESSSYVSFNEFKNISQQILSRHSDIQALEWIPRIYQAQRDSYEQQRAESSPSYEITERNKNGLMVRAKQRDVYYPVHYLEPLVGNEGAFGFDLGSSKNRLATLEKARDYGIPLSTAKVVLVQTQQSGMLTFIPVYQGVPLTMEKRRTQLLGFVLGVFRIDEIFNAMITGTTVDGINFQLIDNSEQHAVLLSELIYPEPDKQYQAVFSYQQKIKSDTGRQWLLSAQPSSVYINKRRTILPLATSLFGILVVMFGSIYTLVIIRRSQVIEQMVHERTKALQDAKLKLEVLTLTDGLTKIPNRRCFDERIVLEWQRAMREQTLLSVIFIDIDYFKLYNDKYGHIEGDSCLKAVAQTLNNSFNRSSDLVARYGGEEFVVILPNTEHLLEVAERCRKNIESLRLRHASSAISEYVTVSLGCTSIVPSEDSSLIDFINQADRALYEAKESGRNKVLILNPTVKIQHENYSNKRKK